jgi:predicted amidohydrolase
MRIAVLQFAPKLGAVKENMEAAEAILGETEELTAQREHGVPLWLVLPEMAFSGKSLGAHSTQQLTLYKQDTISPA